MEINPMYNYKINKSYNEQRRSGTAFLVTLDLRLTDTVS
jgi:hypothetical protein